MISKGILHGFDNNCNFVSNKDRNASFIEEENDNYYLERIEQIKESNLQYLKSKLEYRKNELSINKKNMIESNVESIILIAMEIGTFAIFYQTLSLGASIAVPILAYAPFKVYMYVSRKKKQIEKKKLTSKIKQMESDVLKLEKELMEIKEESKYKASASTVDETKAKAPIEEIYPKSDNYIYYSNQSDNKNHIIYYSNPYQFSKIKKKNKIRTVCLPKRK